MTAHTKCDQCGQWVQVFSAMPHGCKPIEEPVAWMQTWIDKQGREHHTFTNQKIRDDDQPLYTKKEKNNA